MHFLQQGYSRLYEGGLRLIATDNGIAYILGDLPRIAHPNSLIIILIALTR
jgi:hypothetical protein